MVQRKTLPWLPWIQLSFPIYFLRLSKLSGVSDAIVGTKFWRCIIKNISNSAGPDKYYEKLDIRNTTSKVPATLVRTLFKFSITQCHLEDYCKNSAEKLLKFKWILMGISKRSSWENLFPLLHRSLWAINDVISNETKTSKTRFLKLPPEKYCSPFKNGFYIYKAMLRLSLFYAQHFFCCSKYWWHYFHKS